MLLPSSSCPETIVEHKPNEKFAFCWRTCLAEELSSLNRVLTDEEGLVRRSGSEHLVRRPFPIDCVHQVVIKLYVSRPIPYEEVFQNYLDS